jgi:hypothetical protein
MMAKNAKHEQKKIGWDDYVSPAAVTKKRKGRETYARGM